MKVYFHPQTIALGLASPLNYYILVASLLEMIPWHHITQLAMSPTSFGSFMVPSQHQADSNQLPTVRGAG